MIHKIAGLIPPWRRIIFSVNPISPFIIHLKSNFDDLQSDLRLLNMKYKFSWFSFVTSHDCGIEKISFNFKKKINAMSGVSRNVKDREENEVENLENDRENQSSNLTGDYLNVAILLLLYLLQGEISFVILIL